MITYKRMTAKVNKLRKEFKKMGIRVIGNCVMYIHDRKEEEPRTKIQEQEKNKNYKELQEEINNIIEQKKENKTK